MAFDFILGSDSRRDWSCGFGDESGVEVRTTRDLVNLVLKTDKEVSSTGMLAARQTATGAIPVSTRVHFAAFFKAWQDYKRSLGPIPTKNLSLGEREKKIWSEVEGWNKKNQGWLAVLAKAPASRVPVTHPGALAVAEKPTWPMVVGVGASVGLLGWILFAKK